ncbi:MAG TPA: helix-turn-helix transcriptional regulator [Chloroflexota bacterium]|nr:helix-turn-helix transcriptional regulator [Chloroflexota bacterium]
MNQPARLTCPSCGTLKTRVEIGGTHVPPTHARVLALLCQGYSNAQIADALHYSEKTIKNLVSDLLRIFDVQNRTQLAILVSHLEAEHPDPDPDPTPDNRVGRPPSVAGDMHAGSDS